MRMMLAALAFYMGIDAVTAASVLQGHWRVVTTTMPNYVGIVLIDGENRATWDSPTDAGKPANYRGYIGRFEPPQVEIVFTNGANVARTYCLMQSSELMHCHNVKADGTPSEPFTLNRIGPGPASLLR